RAATTRQSAPGLDCVAARIDARLAPAGEPWSANGSTGGYLQAASLADRRSLLLTGLAVSRRYLFPSRTTAATAARAGSIDQAAAPPTTSAAAKKRPTDRKSVV